MRVLVIDDTPSIREVIAALLGDQYEIDEAGDGIQAYLKAKSGTYDIALMDIRMPNFDGISATESIRDLEKQGDRPRLSIIGISAEMSPKMERECLAAGMDDVLAKPFEGRALLSKIHRCRNLASAG
jgi:CheY-like chemotaxis protein